MTATELGLLRLSAACDLMVAEMREQAGMHDYDGRVQDLSPSGVAAGLARLGDGPAPQDTHDAAHLQAVENGLRWRFGERAEHRRNPLLHISELDLACYDLEYAPADVRARARAMHLAAWPDAVDAALASMDAVPAPVADALLPAARGLAADLDAERDPAGSDVTGAALRAHARFVAHLEDAAAHGDPEVAVGEAALAREMGVWEDVDVDVADLARRADAERERLRALLEGACGRLDARRTPEELVPDLLADHPDADGVLDDAREVTAEVLAFTAEHRLAPTDGECLVGPAPPSRRWAMAMMAWAGSESDDAPSWYHVTPPEPHWPVEEAEEWLQVFSRTSLPAITVHEVAPGHFSHGRALRNAASPVRRRLTMSTFAEGWAHYAEEMVTELGFRADDPRYVVGVALEALVRVTRLSCAIGMHAGGMSVAEAAARFERDAFLGGSAARSEARRGTFDVGYGRYTWGKLAILDLRERAKASWGTAFSLPRFHEAMLALGSPPIGLLDSALAG